MPAAEAKQHPREKLPALREKFPPCSAPLNFFTGDGRQQLDAAGMTLS